MRISNFNLLFRLMGVRIIAFNFQSIIIKNVFASLVQWRSKGRGAGVSGAVKKYSGGRGKKM